MDAMPAWPRRYLCFAASAWCAPRPGLRCLSSGLAPGRADARREGDAGIPRHELGRLVMAELLGAALAGTALQPADRRHPGWPGTGRRRNDRHLLRPEDDGREHLHRGQPERGRDLRQQQRKPAGQLLHTGRGGGRADGNLLRRAHDGRRSPTRASSNWALHGASKVSTAPVSTSPNMRSPSVMLPTSTGRSRPTSTSSPAWDAICAR